jgi:hypothetical protein
MTLDCINQPPGLRQQKAHGDGDQKGYGNDGLFLHIRKNQCHYPADDGEVGSDRLNHQIQIEPV